MQPALPECMTPAREDPQYMVSKMDSPQPYDQTHPVPPLTHSCCSCPMTWVIPLSLCKRNVFKSSPVWLFCHFWPGLELGLVSETPSNQFFLTGLQSLVQPVLQQ